MKNIKMVIIASLIFTFSFSIFACASPPESGEKTTLEDKKWVLQSYGDSDNLTKLIADTRITAEFDGVTRQVTGSAGCNTLFSNYEINGSAISFTDVAVTEMYCMEPKGVMNQEQEYLAILQLAESYEIDDELKIYCGSQFLIFRLDTRDRRGS